MLGLATGLLAGGGAAVMPGAMGGIMPAAAAETKKKHPGKRLYRRMTCMACHGKDGRRAIQDYPNLAGQPKVYLVKQVKDIISGKRKGGLNAQGKPRAEAMRGALVTPEGQVRITDAQIEQISDWLASLDPAPPRPPADLKKADIEAGRALYKKKRCRTCHGPEGRKPLKGYPYIAGQKYEYIINQMKDVRDKKRTNGKIKTMYNFVRKLKDEEIAQIAAFLSTVDRTR